MDMLCHEPLAELYPLRLLWPAGQTNCNILAAQIHAHWVSMVVHMIVTITGSFHYQPEYALGIHCGSSMLHLMLLLQVAVIYPVVLVTLGVRDALDMYFAEEPNELVSKEV